MESEHSTTQCSAVDCLRGAPQLQRVPAPRSPRLPALPCIATVDGNSASLGMQPSKTTPTRYAVSDDCTERFSAELKAFQSVPSGTKSFSSQKSLPQ